MMSERLDNILDVAAVYLYRIIVDDILDTLLRIMDIFNDTFPFFVEVIFKLALIASMVYIVLFTCTVFVLSALSTVLLAPIWLPLACMSRLLRGCCSLVERRQEHPRLSTFQHTIVTSSPRHERLL